MTSFSSRARELQELLSELVVRVRELRALSLVDGGGLPLVSTLDAGASAPALSIHLLALAREILELLAAPTPETAALAVEDVHGVR